jgi:hypothetical protein
VPQREKFTLPVRPFLYTLDQVAHLLSMALPYLKEKYIWYDGREVGARDSDKLCAHNIAHPTQPPEWRVSEREFIRWLRRKKFKVYERAL